MNVLKFSAVFSAGAAIAVISYLLLVPRAEAAPASTQQFTPSRYALLAAEIDAASLQHGGSPQPRQVLVKTDTHTGQCWILELRIGGFGNIRIEQAHWRPLFNTAPGQQ